MYKNLMKVLKFGDFFEEILDIIEVNVKVKFDAFTLYCI